jgi:1,4-dihydroxy-2-naphthoyl-CoA synthase
MCILSREYPASEALEMGLVTAVVPHAELRPRCAAGPTSC